MFQALFATMNEVLEEIRQEYPIAPLHQKGELLEKLESLKVMSDICIEEWLQFEEHMGVVHRQLQQSMEDEVLTLEHDEEVYDITFEMAEQFERGQGYYELSMYDHALKEFKELSSYYPDFIPARLYLALCYFIKEDLDEAAGHFMFIITTGKDRQNLAISYHALACIHLNWDQQEKAEHYFQLAKKADPSLNFYSLS